MILRRLGNKKKLVNKILQNVPQHNVYIEPFFGTGSVYFSKPKVIYNFLNDLDDDVFNLYQITSNNWQELYDEILLLPVSMSLYKYWVKNKETIPMKKALRFLFLSNFGYMGKIDSLHITTSGDPKKQLLLNMVNYKSLLSQCTIANLDFKKFFKSISILSLDSTIFCYCDPPYLNTTNIYSDSFTEQDTIDLLDILKEWSLTYKNFYYAISEFENDFIVKEAKKRNLNINILGERQTMKNRNVEILLTNYEYSNDKLTIF